MRHVMRRVPSPVTVVTTRRGGVMRGITIGSFVSTSLEPPLITFNVGRETLMHPVIVEAERFAVHLLGAGQAHYANHFALPDQTPEEQFEGVDYVLADADVPILIDAPAILQCSRYAIYEAGDHSIVVGEVVRIDENREAAPLLYYERGFRSVGEAVEAKLFEPVKRVSSEAS